MITIDIGGSRDTLLKLASDIQSIFSGNGVEDITFYAQENSTLGGEVQIRFSNEDMDDRDDLPADSIIVEIERG